MESQNKVLWIAVGVVALVVAGLLLQSRVEEALAPELVGALVAIELDGSGTAKVGIVETTAGTPFTLRAVLVAEDRDGRPVYYSEAPALVIGEAPVAPDQVRPWDREGHLRARWFTVEGTRPYLDLAAGLAAFEVRPLLRSNWPLAWSVPGELEPAADDHLVPEAQLPRLGFGTQRYRVQVELYAEETGAVPERTIASPGVEELRRDPAGFPTVHARLANAAGPASLVFGLPQLEPPADADAELLRAVEELARLRLAFTRLTVLRDQIRAAKKRTDEVTWRPIQLDGTARWGREVRVGELLRVGDRAVVLHEDHGSPGVLDALDLCFDFVQGAAVRPLGEVFAGVGQTLDHAPLFTDAPAG